MPYTLILRSSDRADPTSNPNDFYIKTGLNSFLNDHTDWRICIKQLVLPPTNVPWTHNGSSWASTTNSFLNTSHVELRLNFGGSIKSYDSRIKGSQIAHFEPCFKQTNSTSLFTGDQKSPIYYDIVKPNSTEIRIQLFDQEGVPLVNYATNSANSQTLNDWVLIIQIEEINCH